MLLVLVHRRDDKGRGQAKDYQSDEEKKFKKQKRQSTGITAGSPIDSPPSTSCRLPRYVASHLLERSKRLERETDGWIMER